jgi:hypothetical protein
MMQLDVMDRVRIEIALRDAARRHEQHARNIAASTRLAALYPAARERADAYLALHNRFSLRPLTADQLCEST